MSMQHLHLRDRRGYLGVWEMAQVQAEFGRGRYRADTMSWRPGETAWTSLGRRWSPRMTPWLPVLGALALFGCLVLGVALPLWGFHIPGRLPLPLAWHLSLFAVSLILTATVLGIAIKRDPGYGPSRAWTSVWLLILALPLIAALLYQVVSNDRARHEDPDARMVLSADRRVLSIDGSIAANFIDDFKAAMARAPHLQRIDIRSGGGLVGDALEVAKIIRARDLVVRVDDYCASACSLLWAASPERELGLRGSIGLHQNRMLGNAPKEWRESALAQGDAQSRAILLRAGFGPGLLSKRSHTPPTSMAWIDATELVESGVSVRILDAHGKPATPAAIAMAGALHQMGASDASWRTYLAYAAKQPDQVLQRAPSIRQALLAKDKDIAVAWLGRLYADMTAFAFGRSTDADMLRWGKDVSALWDDTVRTQDKAQCNTLLDNGERPQSEQTRARVRDLLADLIARTAVQAPQRAVSDAEEQATRLRYNTLFWTALASQPRPVEWTTWSQPQRCKVSAQLYQEALSLPPAQAAAALRALRIIHFD
ncbi:hypothetical protein A7D17_18740 [Xanthomonas floridensis]|uniref:GYF domain-containing protein n=3 Tax=Xanthomonas floridensis TaxID=1843580 RepID=A0A1A9M9L9_9XANT|nr:hypothetical protein A7D17_18740 [Xanthomonas floridensis]